jgi:hypothetical protein
VHAGSHLEQMMPLMKDAVHKHAVEVEEQQHPSILLLFPHTCHGDLMIGRLHGGCDSNLIKLCCLLRLHKLLICTILLNAYATARSPACFVLEELFLVPPPECSASWLLHMLESVRRRFQAASLHLHPHEPPPFHPRYFQRTSPLLMRILTCCLCNPLNSTDSASVTTLLMKEFDQ